ncbi:hypothetical protein FSARC_14956 [Fusarium sarcochroum]|uniref:Heterokaryon incompatibility domain-containing protein n=1 Tax=Fusarium sarcochroum TaxID=1208366 RepID=A0A8H4SPQ7_9HYPO|nr:hypothetical protein FSARC_14956 [Fusarium sarcochroum]
MSRSSHPQSLALPGQAAARLGQHQEQVIHSMEQWEQERLEKITMPRIVMLHDNSIGGVRGWGEPLLFVPGSPAAILPSGPLAVEYNWGGADDGDTPDGDGCEDAYDSMQLRSAHHLCVACKHTFNYFCRYNQASGDERIRMKNNVLHSESLSSLFMFAILAKCFICRQTWSKIKTMYPNLDPNAPSSYGVECCWTTPGGSGRETKMWMVLYDASTPKRPSYNYQHILRIGLWPKEHYGTHFDKDTDQRTVVNSRGAWDDRVNDNTTDSAKTRSLAQSWFARCTQNTSGQHDICNRKDGTYLPSRLLDVRSALERGQARLVFPSETPEAFDTTPRYATLSHCWGTEGANEHIVLLTQNVEARRVEGAAWNTLPKTFQDAFKIAAWLGLDWLWIDSMCIIQNSPSDWQKEASVMDRVYMNAEVNISADWGKDSQAGCFSKRNEIDIVPLEFANSSSERAWIVTTEDAFSWMGSAPSLSRAWIHRERQLARRILHFTKNELVWECCGQGRACFASETMPGGSPFEKVFKGEIKFQIQFTNLAMPIPSLQEQSAEDRLDKIHELWNSTCQDLSNKSVTYASDLPVILSSLAKEFQALMPDDDYVAGLWRSTLVDALTWWVPGDKPEYDGYIAPSWSWLSAASPVKLYHPGHRQRKRAVAEIVAINTKMGPTGDDPYGQLVSGSSLRVRGFLRRLHFHFVGPPDNGIILSVVEKDSDGWDRLRVIGPDWDKHEGQVFRLTTDSMLSLPYQEWECYALFTTLNEAAQFLRDCRRELSCILLENVTSNLDSDHGDENVYKRIGTLERISDTYSFKMRYRVAEDSTVREAGSFRDCFEENPTGYTGRPQPETWFNREEDGGAAESKETDVAEDTADASADGRRDSASSTDTDYAEGEIWIWLVQYIQRKRWSIVREFEEKQKKGKKTLKEGSSDLEQLGIHGQRNDDKVNDDESQVSKYGSPEDNNENDKCDEQDEQDGQDEAEEDHKGNEQSDKDNDEEEERRREDLHLSVVIVQTHDNPSSDLAPISTAVDKTDAWRRLQEAQNLVSQTTAYGTNQPHDPAATLYQFDDVLHEWQELRGVVPWLERLEATEIILV